jgi:type IV pilus assembly protein PilA
MAGDWLSLPPSCDAARIVRSERRTFMATSKRLRARGFTLVELMIVVAIIGVLAALAIYGVRRYLASAKSAEAKNSLGAIARNAQAVFERETFDTQILGDAANSTALSHAVCKSAAAAVPVAVPPGDKYQPSTMKGADFDAGDALTGWKCLKFTISTPIYYRYNYKAGGGYVSAGLPGAPDPGATGFEGSAQGDLDANGVLSTLARGGTITPSGQLKLSTQVFVNEEFE